MAVEIFALFLTDVFFIQIRYCPRTNQPFYRPPPHDLRHPQIFYYGHTPCLYINKLRVAGVLADPVNPYFESIFEVGVDEMLWDDMVS